MNPVILVEMIQCKGSKAQLHWAMPPRVHDIGKPFMYGTCVYCQEPVFSDLSVKDSLVNSPMQKFTDAEGHLWVGNQPTYLIQEEPF
jgi:hypothetical protein